MLTKDQPYLIDLPAAGEYDRRFNDTIWIEAAARLLNEHRLDFVDLRRAERGENIVVLADDRYVVKIYTPKKRGFARERDALRFAQGKISIHIPQILAEGEIAEYQYLITDQLPGRLISRPEWLKLGTKTQIRLITKLAQQMKEMHSHDATEIDFDWPRFIENQLATVMARQRREGGNPEWLASLPGYLEKHLSLLPRNLQPAFLHGDVHFGNLLFSDNGNLLDISGLFDLADSLKGFYEYEFVAIGVLMIQGQGDLQREFFRAYGYRDDEINIDLRRRLMVLTILYEHSSLRRYAERLGQGSEKLTLEELEKAIWNFV
jgi:hygromycin-B 7''-O-kinase